MKIKSAIIGGRWLLNETWGSFIPEGLYGGWFLHSGVLESSGDESYNVDTLKAVAKKVYSIFFSFVQN